MTVMSLLMVLVLRLMLLLLLQFRLLLHASGGVGVFAVVGGVTCDRMPSRAGNGRQVVNSNLVPMSKFALPSTL